MGKLKKSYSDRVVSIMHPRACPLDEADDTFGDNALVVVCSEYSWIAFRKSLCINDVISEVVASKRREITRTNCFVS